MRPVDRLVAAAFRHGVRGRGRVAGALYGSRPGRSVPTTLNGLRWEADPLDWMDQRVLATGTYEPEITQLLLDHLGPGDVLWDIGANAGVHALSVKQARPEVTVVAFEPSPVHYARLCHNAAANRLEILAFCVALADERTYSPFSVLDRGNSGLNSLVPWENVVYSRTFPCWCDTGTAIVRGGFAPPPNVMKVDVEGAETAVFGGMTEVLASSALRVVVFENAIDLFEQRRAASDVLIAAGFHIDGLPNGGTGLNWIATKN